jgi:hypothetical protein
MAPGRSKKSLSAKERLREELGHAQDIRIDLAEVARSAKWIQENFYDVGAIPRPWVDGHPIDLTRLYLDGLLMLYRKCFTTGRRTRPASFKPEAVGALAVIHNEELMARADRLVAHAVHGAGATAVKIGPKKAVYFSSSRPVANLIDFQNLRALSEAWLRIVDREVARLTRELAAELDGHEEEALEDTVVPWGVKGQRPGANKRS